MNKVRFGFLKKGLLAFLSGVVALLVSTSLVLAQSYVDVGESQLIAPASAVTAVNSNPTADNVQIILSGSLAQTNDTATPVVSATDQNIMNRDTAGFLRAVQKTAIAFGSVAQGMATQNAEQNYVKLLARDLFDTTQVQQAFTGFNDAANAASSKCYAAQGLVLSHTGFDENGNTTSIADAGTTLTNINNDLAACVNAYQSAFTNLTNELTIAYQVQKNMPTFTIPSTGNGDQRITLPITSTEVTLVNDLGTNKLQDLTAAFIRDQQVANKYAGYITLADNTMNREHSYMKMLERDGFDITLVQQAFTTFDTAANAAIKACGPAQTVVSARAGFDMNNVVTNQSDAMNTVSTAATDLATCHDAMASSFNPLSATLMNLALQLHGLPDFGAPTIN